MDALAEKDLRRVRAMCRHLAFPYWMPAPSAWLWRGRDNRTQTLFLPDEPGGTNLLWLAMGMQAPPERYDIRDNSLMFMVLTHGAISRLGGECLLDQAAVLPLADFHALLPEAPMAGNPLEAAYPLLRLLASRRLAHGT